METKNYDLFKFRINRPIDNGLVKRLKDSIIEIGYIKSRPIIVDEQYNILDGQHRYIACKELNIPVVWDQISCNGDADKIIIQLNKNQLVWRISEYIQFYAQKGIECYVEFIKFNQMYRHETSTSIAIFIGERDKSKQTKLIKSGNVFKINEKAHEIAQFIKEINLTHKWAAKLYFVRAVVILFERANENQIQKLFDNRLLMFEQPTKETYLKLFESIINRYCKTNILKLTEI
jgi:hypothetical protein